MQLRVTNYQDIMRWRWELQDDKGNFLGDYEVKLDTDAPEYAGSIESTGSRQHQS